MSDENPHRVDVEYRSDYASIPVVRERFREFLVSLAIDPEGESGFGLMLALTECVSNVIRHAHDQDGRKARTVFELSDGCIRIFVYDTSPEKPFGEPSDDPEAIPDLDGESGRGLFLMQSLTDEISYETTRTPPGKLVVLTKAIA